MKYPRCHKEQTPEARLEYVLRQLRKMWKTAGKKAKELNDDPEKIMILMFQSKAARYRNDVRLILQEMGQPTENWFDKLVKMEADNA